MKEQAESGRTGAPLERAALYAGVIALTAAAGAAMAWAFAAYQTPMMRILTDGLAYCFGFG